MYTSHHPCWDAKNRHGLAEELPLDYAQIAHCIPDLSQEPQPVTPEKEQEAPAPVQETIPEQPKDPEVPEPPKQEEPVPDEHQKALKTLFELIDRNGYDRAMIQWAVTSKGYYPVGTPIENYETDFIKGVLIAAWDQVDAMIQEQLEKNIPF